MASHRFAVAGGGADAYGGVRGGSPVGRRQVVRRRGRFRCRWRPSYHTVPQAVVPAATVRYMSARRDRQPKQRPGMPFPSVMIRHGRHQQPHAKLTTR